MKKRLRMSAVVGATLLLACSAGRAQVRLLSSVIGAGGGAASGPGSTVKSTVGQGVIGPVGAETQSVRQGFWYTTAPAAPLSAPRDEAVADGMLSVMPNPFAGEATLHLQLPRTGRASVELFDPLGRRVATLADGMYEAGAIAIRLDGSLLPSGAYTARLVAGDIRRVIRVVLAK